MRSSSSTDPTSTKRTHNVFADTALDDEMSRQGYVVVDFLDPVEVKQMRSAWAELSAWSPPLWDPTGMAATIRHPGLDWAAHDRIMPIVTAQLARLAPGTACFMSTFLAKRPWARTLPAHLDWRLVDEPDDLTYGCWIALQDMDDRVGALGVVPGSHRLVDFDRTPVDPGHDWTLQLVESGASTSVVKTRAGQAVVFDHRLVHFSGANDSAEIRLAVNLGIGSPGISDQACERLLSYMAQGVAGAGCAPQIPDLAQQLAVATRTFGRHGSPPSSGG